MTTPSAPGTQIVSRAAPPSRSGPSTTGTWHVAMLTERGPTNGPRLLRNLTEYDTIFGNRVTYGQRDAVEAHFRNGGSRVNLVRIVGPAATKATIALPGAAAAPSISVDSEGEGASTFAVAINAAAGGVTLSVYDGSTLLTTSPVIDTPQGLAQWSETSPYVTVRVTGAVLPTPTASPAALVGGNDDRAAVTDAHKIAAINKIPKGDGPGQVSIPGSTTAAVHAALAQHAEANNRFALPDLPNTTVATDLSAAVAAARVLLTPLQRGFGFACEGWHAIQGITLGTTRVVPPSAIVSALMAKRDAQTGNPNDPAAGVNGVPTYSLGPVRPEWSDDQRATLNRAGVNVFRRVAGESRLYGYRTLADPDSATSESAWLGAGNARLRMAMQAEADVLAEPFVFSQITKTKIAEYNGAITGMCLGYYTLGALFGDTPQDAFVVVTDETVNTPQRLAERRLSAVIGARMSEFAEIVYMEFVKVAITEVLA